MFNLFKKKSNSKSYVIRARVLLGEQYKSYWMTFVTQAESYQAAAGKIEKHVWESTEAQVLDAGEGKHTLTFQTYFADGLVKCGVIEINLTDYESVQDAIDQNWDKLQVETQPIDKKVEEV